MQIRNRLTLQFAGIVAFILLVFSITIYQQAYQYTYNEFEDRLNERALNTGQLFLDVEEIDDALLKSLRRKFLQNLPFEFVRIYDQNNKIVFEDDSVNIKLMPATFSRIRKEGKYGFNLGKRQFLGIVYDDKNGKYVVLASAIDMFGQSKLRNLRLALLLAYIIALVIIIITGRFFAKSALKPISAVVENAEKITASNLFMRLPTGRGRDEIEKLAIAFNNMFERLGSAFEMQKSFVSNASHELRTPLTAIKGEIEVALMKDRTPEQYKNVLESILEETAKMTNLSNGLLQLAQAGIEFNVLSFKKIMMEEIVLDLHESFQKHNKDGKLILDFASPEINDGFYVSGSKELLTTAIQNVINNAFKFSSNKPVTLKLFQEDGFISLAVQDQGVGIDESEINHIFEPFYRSDNVRSIAGHGIGLSLTQKIVRLHKGHINISSKPGIGTKITISLPAVSDGEEE